MALYILDNSMCIQVKFQVACQIWARAGYITDLCLYATGIIVPEHWLRRGKDVWAADRITFVFRGGKKERWKLSNYCGSLLDFAEWCECNATKFFWVAWFQTTENVWKRICGKKNEAAISIILCQRSLRDGEAKKWRTGFLQKGESRICSHSI